MKKQRKLIRIIYEYENETEEITGKYLENFEDNLNSASTFCVVHGMGFKPVKWKKIKKTK